MIIFIIPAYNEEQNIDLLLTNMSRRMEELHIAYHVILINDGSTDLTKETALKFSDRISLEVIDHDTNRGVGQVFRSGFRRALELAKDGDVIITKEADNTSSLDILPDMLKELELGNDLVLASCYSRGGKIVGTTLDRIILSFCANLLIKILFSVKGAHTYSSFYRAHKAEMLRKAFYAYGNRLIESSGFTSMAEMLIKLSRLPIRVSEVPMILHCDFRKGKSKMKKKETIYEYFCLIYRELSYKKKDLHNLVIRYEENV